jgi:hypothetical protein
VTPNRFNGYYRKHTLILSSRQSGLSQKNTLDARITSEQGMINHALT